MLIFDASRRPDVDALHAQALELALRRAGVRALCLTFDFEPGRLARALETLTPRVVLLTGHRASLDALGRLVYVARRSGTGVGVFDFRGALPESGDVDGRAAPSPGRGPIAARGEVIAHLDGAERFADGRGEPHAPTSA